jgi:hypothetical protein
MADDIVQEVRELVDEACDDPSVYRWGKFDRTLVVPLLEEAERLRAMEHRVSEGYLTEAEFQAICHNLNPADEERFKQGCLAEWRKLFGSESLPATAIPLPLVKDILDQVAKGEMTVEAAGVRLTGRE